MKVKCPCCEQILEIDDEKIVDYIAKKAWPPNPILDSTARELSTRPCPSNQNNPAPQL